MSHRYKTLAILVVTSVGLWGCAQGPANGPGSVERIRALESKNAKLEDDFRAAAAARDLLKKKLTSAEEQRTQLGQQMDQLQTAVKERDDLRQQVTVRTNERDTLQNQFEQLRKGIRGLLGQADTAGTPTTAGTPLSQPVTSAVETPTPGKS
jgi:TolA-binding protein